MGKHLNLLFPQWQGGPKREIYDGAVQLVKSLEKKLEFEKIVVSLDDELVLEKNIIGYQSILGQLKATSELIIAHNPASILTIGGNCSVGIIPIAYLNQYFRGDLAVVWLDAHGDINTPERSLSKFFTGMPVRHLLGDGDSKICSLLHSNLKPDQIVLAGTRSLDEQESDYIKKAGIKTMSSKDLTACPEAIANYIVAKGYSQVYVHVDTDVLSESTFAFSAWPSQEGIDLKTLANIFDGISKNCCLVGSSLVEFLPCDDLGIKQLQSILNKILPLLKHDSDAKNN